MAAYFILDTWQDSEYPSEKYVMKLSFECIMNVSSRKLHVKTH